MKTVQDYSEERWVRYVMQRRRAHLRRSFRWWVHVGPNETAMMNILYIKVQ